jgi:hypothetical protein
MSLLRHLKSKTSPVHLFFLERFGDASAARRALRVTEDAGIVRADLEASPIGADPELAWRLGNPVVRPVELARYPWPTVGTAFDYRARFFFDPAPAEDLVAYRGARELASYFGNATTKLAAFVELRDVLADLLSTDPSMAGPSREESMAKACYALALYEQCRRARPDDAWPLVQAGPKATLEEIYSLAVPAVIEDLTRLALTFSQSQRTLLATRPYVANPTFGEASIRLDGADADLIVGDRLIDIKTTTDDTIERLALWQIAGYTLSDLDDDFHIREVGLYFSRHGVQAVWSLEGLLSLLSGGPADLVNVRSDFRRMLEGLESDREIARRDRVPQFGWTPPVRDRSTETIKRAMTFRPPVRGKGKWHVAYADNPVTGAKPGVTDPASSASCGNTKAQLDVQGKTFKPTKGHHASEYAERLCARCLDYGGPFHELANTYPERVILSRDHWKFREPVHARLKWHIARPDFYDEKRRSLVGICNSGDAIKAQGQTLLVPDDLDDADADLRLCRHCIIQVRQALKGGSA